MSVEIRDKTAGFGTNVQDIIPAVNRRIKKGFNFDDNWIALDSGAQTSLFNNAKDCARKLTKVELLEFEMSLLTLPMSGTFATTYKLTGIRTCLSISYFFPIRGFAMGHHLIHEGVHCANTCRAEVGFLKVRGFVHL